MAADAPAALDRGGSEAAGPLAKEGGSSITSSTSSLPRAVGTARRIRAPLVGLLAGLAPWLLPAPARAGPPFTTDDPEPVAYRHWELYLATQAEVTRAGATGTGPHVEVNYGAAPNVQLHLIVPLAYALPAGGPRAYGPGDVELGAKLRFVQEGKWLPMIGAFPLVELPAGSEARGLGAGHVQAFVPVWLQKSFGPWTSYGGGGYWLNQGASDEDHWLVGWLVQRRLWEPAALGVEVFYATPDRAGGEGELRFNVGLTLDLGEHHHLLVSAGRSVVGDSSFQGYLAYQLTI